MKYFKFNGVFPMEENDFEEICNLVIKEKKTIEEAVNEVSSAFDDCDYYIFNYVYDDVVEAVAKELNARGITDFEVRDYEKN